MDHLKTVKLRIRSYSGGGSGVSKKKNASAAVFGQPLDNLEQPIPFAVLEMTNYLLSEALELEGVFRVPGSTLEIKKMKAMYDDGQELDFRDSNLCKSPHSVAGLLKLFFRELPVPLLTNEFYDCFIATNSITVPSARLDRVKKILQFLPPAHRNLLFYLIGFLRTISAHAHINKMTAGNLAMVFAPNLLRANLDSDFVQDSGHATKIVETLITDYEFVFEEISLEYEEAQVASSNSNLERQQQLEMSDESNQSTATANTQDNTQESAGNNSKNVMRNVSSSFRKLNLSLKETIKKGKDNLSSSIHNSSNNSNNNSNQGITVKSSHSVNLITSIDEDSGQQPLTLERRQFVLFGPRPNPFSSSTSSP